MTLFQSQRNQRAYEIAISVLVIATLFTNITTVQAIEKASATDGIMVKEAYIAPEVTFPVAGERKARYSKTVRLSFYTSDVYQTDATPCIPADGTDLCIMAENGTVDAVAANFLYLGTQVRFPELDIEGITIPSKLYTVRDRMNAKFKGNQVDMYLAVIGEDGKIDHAASKAKAKQLGVKYVTMEVL